MSELSLGGYEGARAEGHTLQTATEYSVERMQREGMDKTRKEGKCSRNLTVVGCLLMRELNVPG